MKNLIAVAVGGALGASVRYYIGLWLNTRSEFPWGTFTVNLVGSFIIGFVVFWAAKHEWPSAAYLFLVTGVLGGFTTFSAFSFENLKMIQDGRTPLAIGYASATVLLGLALAWGGFSLAQKMAG